VARLGLEQHLKIRAGTAAPKIGFRQSENFAEAQRATLGRASGDARDKPRQDPRKVTIKGEW